MNRLTALFAFVVCSLLLVACGGNTGGGTIDASGNAADATAADADESVCGDGVPEGNEQCDDANMSEDDLCLNNCMWACGDGVVNMIENCDTGIADGDPGACPATCDDMDSCTSDQLSGTECAAQCINSPITVPADDDGCCPPGEDANTDNDCMAICGNMVVEVGETCDTGITGGNPGECPVLADCDDTAVCTTDTLLNGGTCSAECQNTAITLPMDDDGCCPPNANSNNDNDCTGVCGNGVLESGEACDTAIGMNMPGACPTGCNDNDSCTTDTLLSGGTCAATCTNAPITSPINGDSCCPSGANANNDDDCTPVCGNTVIEAGEQCDDGNTMSGDGCSATCQTETTVATAFRFDNLSLRDPHIFAELVFCFDVTETAPFGNPGVNQSLNENISLDGDMDGLLDLSVAAVFRPLAQGSATSPVEVRFPDCTTSPIECTDPETTTPILTTANNQNAGTCLQPVGGTTSGYTPPVASTPAPCFATDLETLTLNVAGIQIVLTDAQVSGTYNGNPATSLSDGMVMGFISEADALATTLPMSLPIIGGNSLASVFPGGAGNCDSGDDRDVHNGVTGWWLYFNYTSASSVTWIAP